MRRSLEYLSRMKQEFSNKRKNRRYKWRSSMCTFRQVTCQHCSWINTSTFSPSAVKKNKNSKCHFISTILNQSTRARSTWLVKDELRRRLWKKLNRFQPRTQQRWELSFSNAWEYNYRKIVECTGGRSGNWVSQGRLLEQLLRNESLRMRCISVFCAVHSEHGSWRLGDA